MQRHWTVEFLNATVEAEFLSLPKELQARLVRKKTQKTPPGEIARALSRMKEIDDGQDNG